MRVSARQLNRATLDRQLLLERRQIGVVDAVHAVFALQAQSPASPYIALWNRVAGFDPAELDRAFAAHRIVKATLIRIALHAVAADDYPAVKRAMLEDLRRSCLGDRRFRSAGLSKEEADALVPQLTRFASRARTTAELEAEITELADVPGHGVWWAMRRFAPMVHAPTGPPWAFGDRPAYVAPPLGSFDGSREEALPVLVRRYLEAFGPASASDVTQFTMIPQPPIKAALAALADELETVEGPDGKPMFDVPGGALPPEDAPAPPRLLGMWDNVLLSYKDRSRVIPEPYRKLVLRMNGDTLPAVLVDGFVAGVWRPAPERRDAIEVSAFHELTQATWDALDAEASSLVGFLADRQPDVYRRHANWWKTMPSVEVRRLGG